MAIAKLATGFFDEDDSRRVVPRFAGHLEDALEFSRRET